MAVEIPQILKTHQKLVGSEWKEDEFWKKMGNMSLNKDFDIET